MEIKFDYKERELSLIYNSKGILDCVVDLKSAKKMMMELTQVGSGYEMSRHNGFIPMDMCNAVYVRIMELDVFVPKFIFIPNEPHTS